MAVEGCAGEKGLWKKVVASVYGTDTNDWLPSPPEGRDFTWPWFTKFTQKEVEEELDSGRINGLVTPPSITGSLICFVFPSVG